MLSSEIAHNNQEGKNGARGEGKVLFVKEKRFAGVRETKGDPKSSGKNRK